MTTKFDAFTILAVDVGTVNTKAVLFDVVDGRYRFIARSTANTTTGAPYFNAGEGIRLAVDQLQETTGRTLVDQNYQLIIPTSADGAGVDRFAATISAGPPLKVVVLGLLENVSGESALKLAHSTYSEIAHAFNLNDRLKPEARLNLIVQSQPDLVIAAGGTDGGATQSLIGMLEAVGLACYLLPQKSRPELLFAGNQALQSQVVVDLQSITQVHITENIRPSLDFERLEAAQSTLGQIFTANRVRTMPGIGDLETWAKESFLPTASAFGRLVRFLSAYLKEKKGVLGVDLGAANTVVAAAYDSELSLSALARLGLSKGMDQLLKTNPIEEIVCWLPSDISADFVREYLLNKSLYPTVLPSSPEAQQIEGALARQILRQAIKLARNAFPSRLTTNEAFLPQFEPILASGCILSNMRSVIDSALLLLDGLQPSGITTLILDQNQIASAIGAAAVYSPLLAVQVMDSNSFLNVGTIIAPIANVKNGQPVLRMKISYQDGQISEHEVLQGSLQAVSVPFGQTAKIALNPLHRADIGMGAPGRGGSLTVKGGALGVIVDARGRPISLPKDRQKQIELNQKWLWTLENR